MQDWLPKLAWPPEAADRYDVIVAQLHQSDQPIGEMDILIAAQALVAGLTLVTHKSRHFERIPDLRLEGLKVRLLRCRC